jgi:CBS domain-containing protein
MATVKDILNNKRSSEVHSIGPKATVFQALAVLGERMIGALMVKDDNGEVVGIITERDYARKIILQGRGSRDTTVEEIMTPRAELFTVTPETTDDDCMVVITGKKIRHLPVFDGDKFVGLISIGDVVRSKVMEQERLIEQLSDYIAGKYV